MHKKISPGAQFRALAIPGKALPVVGVLNAYSAKMAEKIGFQAIYLSGSVLASSAFGLPDLGITSLDNVLEDARRITATTNRPLLVDIDTGWGGAFNIARAIGELNRAGVAAVHIEDQAVEKRCGHRPNKQLVAQSEMVDRIKAAVDARIDEDFVIMARTDAYANEGMSSAIERAQAYLAAGADMIFPEALASLAEYREFTSVISFPVLANITEFGQTPLFTQAELAEVGVAIVLYPCSAARAMNRTAERVYQTILQQGSQQPCVADMQTREELYAYLDYYAYEKKIDKLFNDKGE